MLQSVIGQIGIFMICAQAILQFRPKEAYGKYLRLLFSAMILMQIVQPISGLFFGGSGVELEKSMLQFQSSLEGSMNEAAKRAKEAELQLEEMSFMELEKRLDEQGTLKTGEQAENAQSVEAEAAEEDGAVQPIEIAPVEKIQIMEGHGYKDE